MTRHRLVPRDVEALRRLYPDYTAEVVARTIGCSVKAVYTKAHELGLSKSAEWIAEQAREAMSRLNHGGRRSQFTKGFTPWNKGIKGSTGTQDGCRATQFRPGRLPQDARNYVPIGSERMTKDGYLERKVTDDQDLVPARRWVAVHRLVWEATHGPVPAGHVVIFRPGQKTIIKAEITVDRLELVSRRELMLRNTVHRHGPEIARVHQLRGAITRQINKRLKDQTT
jgi:hypothetical protein